MIAFLVAFAAVQAVAWFWGTYQSALDQVFVDASTWRSFLLPVVLLPVACAWIGAEIGSIVRPFDRRKRSPLVHILRWGVCGLVAGGVTIVVEGVALTINAERVSDYWIMGACPLLVALVAIIVSPRANTKSGCPSCGYDWTGLSRCPECGGGRPATH